MTPFPIAHLFHVFLFIAKSRSPLNPAVRFQDPSAHCARGSHNSAAVAGQPVALLMYHAAMSPASPYHPALLCCVPPSGLELSAAIAQPSCSTQSTRQPVLTKTSLTHTFDTTHTHTKKQWNKGWKKLICIKLLLHFGVHNPSCTLTGMTEAYRKCYSLSIFTSTNKFSLYSLNYLLWGQFFFWKISYNFLYL